MSGHVQIYPKIGFKDTKSPTVDHNTVRFHDMKNFDAEIFAHDVMSCDILNGSQDEDEISRKQCKLAYTEICDEHAPMKSLRLKKRSYPWITHDIIKLMYQRENLYTKNEPLLCQNYWELRNKVTRVIKERKNAYFSDINIICGNDTKRMWSEIKIRLAPDKK